MSKEWQYQLRITMADGPAETARLNPLSPTLRHLTDILERHGASLKCQYEAFADYVAEAAARGTQAYPLYAWTNWVVPPTNRKFQPTPRSTIENQ